MRFRIGQQVDQDFEPRFRNDGDGRAAYLHPLQGWVVTQNGVVTAIFPLNHAGENATAVALWASGDYLGAAYATFRREQLKMRSDWWRRAEIEMKRRRLETLEQAA